MLLHHDKQQLRKSVDDLSPLAQLVLDIILTWVQNVLQD